MLGTSTIWSGIVADAAGQAGGYIGVFAPVLGLLVGIFAFGLIVYLVVSGLQKR